MCTVSHARQVHSRSGEESIVVTRHLGARYSLNYKRKCPSLLMCKVPQSPSSGGKHMAADVAEWSGMDQAPWLTCC